MRSNAICLGLFRIFSATPYILPSIAKICKPASKEAKVGNIETLHISPLIFMAFFNYLHEWSESLSC